MTSEGAGVPWFLPWMSLAIAPPTVTCWVPGTTGTIQPVGTSRGSSSPIVTPAPAVTVPPAVSSSRPLQAGGLEHETARELGRVAVATAQATGDRSARPRVARAHHSGRPHTKRRSSGAATPTPRPPPGRAADAGARTLAISARLVSRRHGRSGRTAQARRAPSPRATGRSAAGPRAPRRRRRGQCPYRSRQAANGTIVSGRHGMSSESGRASAHTQ